MDGEDGPEPVEMNQRHIPHPQPSIPSKSKSPKQLQKNMILKTEEPVEYYDVLPESQSYESYMREYQLHTRSKHQTKSEALNDQEKQRLRFILQNLSIGYHQLKAERHQLMDVAHSFKNMYIDRSAQVDHLRRSLYNKDLEVASLKEKLGELSSALQRTHEQLEHKRGTKTVTDQLVERLDPLLEAIESKAELMKVNKELQRELIETRRKLAATTQGGTS